MGRAGLSPVMVGRATELGRLRALFGAAPVPTVALIGGEAGIGKTRLVQELVTSAPAGTLVLAGQADPGTVGRPMELFLDALGKTDTSGSPDCAATVRDPSLSAEERIRAGVDLVQSLSGGGPGLVVFEDLHWADSESLAAFERLTEPDAGPLVVVGTYRPDGLSRRHPAADLLPRLERRHTVTHLELHRLSAAEVSTFLAAVLEHDPSFRLVDVLHRRSGGNPYFLEELVASAGDLDAHALKAAPLPWTVAEVVRNQVDGLEPPVRAVVAAASVLGRRVTFDLLASVTATPETELIDHLRDAVDSGLLVETDADVFSFHHDLAREAIEGALLGRERRRLHESALEALRRAGSRDHVALTHHARGAAQFDQMVAEARLGAHESLHLGSTYQALQLAETGLAEAEDDLDLRSVAAEAASLAGLLDEAAEHGDDWLADARKQADTVHESRALGLRMRVAYELGDLAGMAAFTDALIETVDQLPDEERALAMACVAQSYMLRDLAGPTCEWADKALDLAIRHGFERVRIAAMIEKGSVMVLEPGTAAEGNALLQESADAAEQVGDHVLAARSLVNLVWQARQASRFDEARELVHRMRDHAEAAGFDSLASYARVEALAALAAADGDLDAALDVLDKGTRVDPSHALPRNRRWLAVLRAGLALEANDIEAAATFTEDAKPVTARSAVGVLGLDAHVAARQGDLPRVRVALGELAVAVAEEGYAGPSQIHDIAAAALPAGLDPAELRPFVDQAGILPGNRLAIDHPWRQLLDAQLAEAEGRMDEAADSYAAATSATNVPFGLLTRHRGTAHVGAARTRIALGDLDAARTHAVAAAADLARWHGWRVAELEAVQRRLGLGAEVSGPDSLTPREREVVGLLAEGLTNAGLAERLYISPRTAAVHVSNILSKLGMASRTEVAAWAAREGPSRDG